MTAGPYQLLIILVIVLVLFGGAKLPQLARSLGEAQREFRKGQDEGTDPKADDSIVKAEGESTKPDA